MLKIKVRIENGLGVERTLRLDGHHEVCPRCEGHGTHLNPAIGEHAYTPEEFAESFDEEEATEYFRRGGMYDVKCDQCGGKRVVEVLDRDALRGHRSGKRILKRIEDAERADAEYRAAAASEARMERMMCGDY